MDLAIVLILAGGIVFLWLYLWSRQRQQLGYIHNEQQVEQSLQNTPFAAQNNNSAVLVASEHGQLLYANDLARRWLGFDMGLPDLERIARRTQPAESFLNLFAAEGHASLQIGPRWVEAFSHYIPSDNARRLVVVMRDASQVVRSEATIDLSKAMSLVAEIDETVNASMGVEQVLQTLLTIISKELSVEAGEICLWDEEQRLLHQRGWIGNAMYLLEMSASGGGVYRVGEGVTGWVARYRQPLIIGDPDHPAAVRPKVESLPFKSILAIPLILGETFIGTFELFRLEPNAFKQSDLALLEALSRPISVAIYNALLYTHQVNRVEDIASLQEIASKTTGDAEPIYAALNERIANLVDAEMSGIFLYDEEREALIAQPPFFGMPPHLVPGIVISLPEGSLQREIWRNQPYWISNDLLEEPLLDASGLRPLAELVGIRNIALFPLQVGDERIGIIAVSNKRAEGGFAPRDLQNLRVLAAQATIVVENIRLYQRERRLDAELLGLQEITHAIGALSHEGEFFSEITERIGRLMNIQMCGILLYDAEEQALVSRLPFYGIDSDLISDYRISVEPGTVMAELWEEEDYWYTNNTATDALVFEAGLDQLAEALGVKTTMIAALSAGGRRLGVVQVSNKLDGEDFDDNDARLLLIFATQAAAIIENARLYREVQQSAQQAESLRRIAQLASAVIATEQSFEPVLREIGNLTNSPSVYINIIDKSTGNLVTYPRWIYGINATEPWVQDANSLDAQLSPARSRQPFLSHGISRDKRILPSYRQIAERLGIETTVLVPMIVGDRSVGEIGIANRVDPPYAEDDVQLLQSIAAQIASVIDRLLLYEATGENLDRRIRELDAISRVSNELTTTLDLEAVLDVLIGESVAAAEATGGTVVLLRPSSKWKLANQPEVDRRLGAHSDVYTLMDIEREAMERGSAPVIVGDYSQSYLSVQPSEARSAIAVTILYVDEIVGVLHLYSDEPHRFDERAAAFLTTMASKAAIAYSNALRYREQVERSERLRRRADQLNRIFELGQMLQSNAEPVDVLEAIAYSVQQSVGFDTVLMFLAEHNDGILRPVAHAGMPLNFFLNDVAQRVFPLSLLGKVFLAEFRQSESYYLPAREVDKWYFDAIKLLIPAYEGNRTIEVTSDSSWQDGDMLLVPLLASDGTLLGLMSLDRPHGNRCPGRSTIEILEIFAHQAATMLENMTLYRASIENAEMEARLSEMVEGMSRSLDLRDIATAAGSGIGRILPVNHVVLAILDTEDVVYEIIDMAIDEENQALIQNHRRDTLERTALRQVFEEQTTLFFQRGDSAIEDYEDLRGAYENGENASMLLPLLAGGQCIGVLHLGANDIHAFNRHNLIRRIAQFIATAIENARLFNQAVNLRVLNESVIESIQQGIVVLDNSGRVITINDFMRRRYGWADNALYKDLFTYREHWREFLADNLRVVLEEGRPTEILSQSSVDLEGHNVLRNFYVYPLRSGAAIRGAVLLVEDVTERVRLEKAIENRANQLAALTEISTRITSALERGDVIMQALEEMSWIIEYDTMTIWRRNGPYMVLEGARGVDAQEGMRIRFSEDERVNQMIESRRTTIDGDPDGLKDGLLPGDIGAKSWLGVPLVNQGNIVGMMVLTKDSPGFYEARADQHVAMAFASQVAIALANADLFEQMFARTNELGTLLEAAQATSLTLELDEVLRTVVELMFSALEMDDCAIFEWNEVDNQLSVLVNLNRDGDDTHVMPRGTVLNLTDYPAKHHVLQNREVIVLVDTEELEQSLWPKELEELREWGYGARMLVPLLVREQVIGLIQLQQRSNQPVTQQKVRLARALGAQVAVAIENARLTTEQNTNFEELLTINTLSQAISSTLNLDDMIQVVRQQVPSITGASEMYLALYDSETDEITFPLVVQGDDVVDVPPRMLSDDEVSYVIMKRRTLTLGADYYSLDELRRSLGIKNGEGDIKSYMGVPLIAGDQVVGVLAVRDRERTRAFDVHVERILTTVASQLAAAIQNARLFIRVSSFADELERLVEERTTELEQERDRLDTLYRITSELTQTLDMDLLLARALEMVGRAVNADDGAILLSDPITDNLYSRSVLSDDSPIPVNGNEYRYHPAEQVATWLIQHEQYVVVDDLHNVDFWNPDAPGAADFRSAMGVLLETNDDVQGVMVLLSHRVNAFSEEQVRLLLAAANQVASHISSAELYHLIREQAERLGHLLRQEQEEAERNTAILESIADGVILADADGSVMLFNSAAERILDLPREQVQGQLLSELGKLYGERVRIWAQALDLWAHQLKTDTEGRALDQRFDLGNRVVSVNVSPVFSGERFLGTVAVFRDITRDVEIDRIKSDFITRVSHEFRTPLTPIKGYTDLLLMGAAGSLAEQQENALAKIKSNVDRLATLVDDVLSIAKIDRGLQKLEMVEVDLRELIINVVDRLQQRPHHAVRNHTVHVKIAEDLPNIQADRDRVINIIANVVDNAFSYTPAGGKIDVEAARQPGTNSVLITVRDTGLGIPENFREKVWQRFERYEEHALELEVSGTGLGLPIVKELVALHNGDVWFESEEGVGTTFFISLPINQPGYMTTTQTMIANTESTGD